MLPNVVGRVLVLIFTNPKSRVVALELLARAAVKAAGNTVRIISNVERKQSARASANAAKSSASSTVLRVVEAGVKKPRYRYVLGATLIQIGVVQAWLQYTSLPKSVLLEDDKVDISVLTSTPMLQTWKGSQSQQKLLIKALKEWPHTNRSLSLWICVACNIVAMSAVFILIDAPIDVRRLGPDVYYDINVPSHSITYL